MLSFEEYSKNAKATCLPTAWNEEYLCTGLLAEAGESAAVLAKEIRDGAKEDTKEKKLAELSDILWFLALYSDFLGSSLEEIAEYNNKTAVYGGYKKSRTWNTRYNRFCR